MKFSAVILAALVGGVVGAVCVFVATSGLQQDTASRVETPVNVESESGNEVAQVLDENAVLRERVARLERDMANVKANPTSGSEPTVGETPDMNKLREELLAEVRAEAKTAAEEAVQSEAEKGLSDEERRNLLIADFSAKLKSENPVQREEALEQLRKMRAEGVTALVVERLSDENDAVREAAADYFEDIWDPEALPKLVEVMLNDENLEVAEVAVDALCKSGDENAMAELENCYLHGGAMETAYEAGKALSENNRTEALANGLQRFRDALTHTEARQRMYAVAGLRRWGTAAEEPLVRPLENDEDEGVRRQVREAFNEWGIE